MIPTDNTERQVLTPPVAAREDRATQERLVEALAEYHGAVDAGRGPSRSAFLARYPEIAQELAGYLDGFEFVRNVAPQLRSVEKDDHSSPATAVHATLGDFRILREIGRGGMGVVYEAEQLSIGRRIALKVLPFAAMLDKQHLNRFKNEARAAGTLDHPNIVAIHSVGVERGVHYYAMHLVEGESLAQVIARLRKEREAGGRMPEARLNIEHSASSLPQNADTPTIAHDSGASHLDTVPIAALSTLHAPSSSLPAPSSREYFRTVARLGIQAAEALDHAHANGILHRDVKPANLLVDDEGKLWVTDFGLARLEADAGMTMTGDLIGTLRYMSPEQALAKRGVVDHRSDVYSLGATLYELLTLQPPFAGDDRHELLRQLSFDEPRPPHHINPLIPRDLETIVLKALRKEPTHRYATASELADDLNRSLQGTEIQAKRATYRERAASWARRHPAAARATVLTLTVIGIILLVSTVLIGSAYRRESSMRQKAEANEAVASTKARQADATLTLLLDAFQTPGMKRAHHDVTVADILDGAVSGLEAKFDKDPLTKASLLRGIARCYLNLGFAAKATPLLEESRSIREKANGSRHPDTLAVQFDLAEAYAGEGRLEEALAMDEETLAARRRYLGAKHSDTILSMGSVGIDLIGLGRMQEAAVILEEAVTLTNATAGPESGASIGATCNLANVYVQLGRNDEALEMRRKLYEDSTQLHGPDHLCTLIQMGNLGASLVTLREFDEAIAILSEALRKNEELRGPNHPDTFVVINNLANAYQDQGQTAEALRWHRDLQDRCEASLGPAHISTLQYRVGLAQCYTLAREFDKAASLYESSISGMTDQLGATHRSTLRAMNLLGECYLAMDRFDESTTLLREVYRSRQTLMGVDHPQTLEVADDLCFAFKASKQFDDALSLCETLLVHHKSTYGSQHPETVRMQGVLAEILECLDRDADALRVYDDVLSAAPDTLFALNRRAFLLATTSNEELRNGQRALRDAEKCCELTDYKQSLALATLAAAYAEAGDFESAGRWCLQAIKLTSDAKLCAALEERLESFQAEKPWRE